MKTKTALVLFLSVAALLGVPVASALDSYQSTFNQQYNTAGTRLDTCGICHVNPGGGGPRNPYGAAFGANSHSYAAIEPLDSDGDGFTNIVEINARTFPGNPDDTPVSAPPPSVTTPSPTLTASAAPVPTITSDNESEEMVDDIEPYDGSMGPGNALYGLKMAFEDLDESFTFNASEKLGKQIAHARERIAEAKAELRNKNNEAAEKALERYREKIEEADDSVSGFKDNDSGLLHAQKMIEKHQYVLEQLLASHPNTTGLERAYNNSLKLEEKFEIKTERKLERVREKDGRMVLKEERKEKKEAIEERRNIEEEKVKIEDKKEERRDIKEEKERKGDKKENGREIKEEQEDKRTKKEN